MDRDRGERRQDDAGTVPQRLNPLLGTYIQRGNATVINCGGWWICGAVLGCGEARQGSGDRGRGWRGDVTVCSWVFARDVEENDD